MTDKEKVIRGLECCGYSTFMDKCQECPYDGKDCFKRLKADALALLKAQEPRVRCKDCKHFPVDEGDKTWIGGFGLAFPDDKCPCKCEDGFYSWMPEDDWYCADGERRDDDAAD